MTASTNNEQVRSAEEVAFMVLQLNGLAVPLSQAQFQEADAALRKVQMSYPTETQSTIASQLLRHSVASVRIFGAILLTSVASSPQRHDYRGTFIDHLVHAIEQGDNAVEIRKLCDAIAKLFCSSRGSQSWPSMWTDFWNRCLPVFANNTGEADRAALIKSADPRMLRSALMLIDALADHMERENSQGSSDGRMRASFLGLCSELLSLLPYFLGDTALAEDLESPLAVLAKLFENSLLQNSSFGEDTDKRLGSKLAANFAQAVRLLGQHTGNQLRDVATLVDVVFQYHPELVSDAIWRDLVQFTSDSNRGVLFTISQISQGRAIDDNLLRGARTMLTTVAFYALRIDEIVMRPEDPRWLAILEVLMSEYGRENGVDGGEEFSTQLLQFWNEFFDSATSLGLEGVLSLEALHLIHDIAFKVAVHVTPTLTLSKDDEAESGGASLVQEASEVVVAIFSFVQQKLGPAFSSQEPSDANRLLSRLAENHDNASQQQRLADQTRIATFVAVAGYASSKQANDIAIARILELPVFSSPASVMIPGQSEIHQAARFLGSYAAYFKRHPESLQVALRYLLRVLESEQKLLIATAVQSIGELSVLNRFSLCSYSGALLDRYLANQSLLRTEPSARKTFLGTIASLAYTEGQSTRKFDQINRVIDIVMEDVGLLLSKANAIGTAPEELMSCAVSALESIEEIGHAISRGSKLTTAIDLDEYSNATNRAAVLPNEFILRDRLTLCISLILSVSGLAESGDILYRVCKIFRLETERDLPVAFHFSSPLQLELLRVCVTKQLESDYALSTFAAVLTFRASSRDEQLSQVAREAFEFVLHYIHEQSRGSSDPDILTSAIDLLTTYASKYPDIVSFYAADFALLLSRLHGLITAPESLPKTAVCKLWMALLDDKHGLVAGLSEQHLQALICAICAQITGRKIGPADGAALPRDLEVLSELIGKLVVQSPNVRNAFEGAFRLAASEAINVPGWERFVAQIFMLRGKRSETRKVVSQFWSQCGRSAAVTASQQDDDEDDDVVIVLGD